MTVAAAVGRALGELGVRHVFTLLGSGNFVVTNALRDAGAVVVSGRHETAAVTMADAYARLTGEVGVVTLHQGPGLTNAVTGIAEATKSRTPLLVLAADTAGAAVRSNFRIDQGALAASVGAGAERLHGPDSAVADALRAYRRAVVERRPIVLNMPLDVQASTVVPGDAELGPLPAPVRPAAAAVAALADAVARAERPVILAGRGARGAGVELERLAERTGALLATSAVAAGLFAGSPWDLGISGGFASPVAAELLAEADLVLGFGVSLTMWTTRHGRLLSDGATVVQVDVDADALGANHRVDLGVLGDVAETAGDLLAELDRREQAPAAWRSDAVRDRIATGRWRDERYDDAGTIDAGDGAAIDPRTLTIALQDVLPADRTLAVDSGHFMGWAPMYLTVPDAQGFVFTQGFQSVGLGLATAIGAAVARPDRLTVAALGDGGALMALGELETVVRLGLRMLVVVYDDGAYGAEVHHFGPDGHPVDLVQFPAVDFAAFGRAAGFEAVTVRRPEDLAPVAEWVAGGAGRPLLVDAKVVPTVVAEWLEEAFRGH
ncbi:MAG: Acetolactate synthase [Mycobacterium sp.]|nr:Acetolactate synthase [Mycobacterium sp.]